MAASAQLLTTANATVGTVIERQRITDLPLNGRNFLSLVALSPNVTYGFNPAAQAAGRQGGTRAGVTMSLSGSRATWSNYTLDGITNTDINFNLYIVLPSVEALQEFKVQTGIYPAEFGRAAGQVNVSTKGGTNDYHGSAFEFLRNDKLDAKPYFFKDPENPNQTAPDKAALSSEPMGSRWRAPFRFRSCSMGRTGCSSCPITKIQVPAHSQFVRYDHDGCHAGRRLLSHPHCSPGSSARVKTTNANGTTTVTSSAFPGNQIPASRFDPGSLLILESTPLCRI